MDKTDAIIENLDNLIRNLPVIMESNDVQWRLHAARCIKRNFKELKQELQSSRE